MAKNTRNTNFRLGLDRQQLKEAAQVYGKSAKTAGKDSTKRLEQYIINQIAEKGTKVPTLSDRHLKNIKEQAEAFGVKNALRHLTYAVEKVSGARNDDNFLRLTISDSFSHFYSGHITDRMVDELISRLPQLGATQVDSDMISISPYYANLYEDYAEELEERETDAG